MSMEAMEMKANVREGFIKRRMPPLLLGCLTLANVIVVSPLALAESDPPEFQACPKYFIPKEAITAEYRDAQGHLLFQEFLPIREKYSGRHMCIVVDEPDDDGCRAPKPISCCAGGICKCSATPCT